jgi:hypothetical protein
LFGQIIVRHMCAFGINTREIGPALGTMTVIGSGPGPWSF